MLKRKLSALPADEHNVHKIIITIAVVLDHVLYNSTTTHSVLL